MTEYKIDISRSVRDIIDFYVELGGEAFEIEEGCLGLGVTVLAGVTDKSYKITEYYKTYSFCGHTLEQISNEEESFLIDKMYDRWAREKEEEESSYE